MIWRLRGTLIHLEHQTATLEVDGTGMSYDILVSPTLLGHLTVGDAKILWIHHHKTDMSEMLFGFATLSERELFRSLLRVNGIGGKTALGLLGLGEEALVRAIALEDDALLSSVPWIGKKTAQKIIVELKGSIDFEKSKKTDAPRNTSDALLVSSLVSMWYDKKRVESVVELIDSSLTIEERTVMAIRELAR